MDIPTGCTVAVIDGQTLKLFRNEDEGGQSRLKALPHDKVDVDHKGSGGRHHTSSANPDDRSIDEDGFAAGAARLLNTQIEAGRITSLIVVAAPRTLGELRKHFSKVVTNHLLGEVAKDLTNSSIQDIEKAVSEA